MQHSNGMAAEQNVLATLGGGARELAALAGDPGSGPVAARAPAGAAPEAWLGRAHAEAAEIEYEGRFHARAQFEACAAWERRNMQLGIIMAALGALTAGTIATAFADTGLVSEGQQAAALLPPWSKAAFAGGALIAGVFAAAARFLDPQGRATLHSAAGKRYTALADEARQFRNLVLTPEAERAELLGRLQAMAKRRAEIHEAAPVIPARAIAQTRSLCETDRGLQHLATEAGRRPG